MIEHGITIDNDEKQAVRDKFTAQCRSYLVRFGKKYDSFKAFSLAGALFPDWRSQWDNPLGSERVLTREYPNLEWLCTNRDPEVFYSIPEDHRYGDRPSSLESKRVFGNPIPGDERPFDIVNLDLTCGFEKAMGHVDLILRNGWLWEEGLLAIWFDNDRRALPRNKAFLAENNTRFREYFEELLRHYGYRNMADNGASCEPYKQYNKSSKSDAMVLLMASAARPALRNAYEMM